MKRKAKKAFSYSERYKMHIVYILSMSVHSTMIIVNTRQRIGNRGMRQYDG